ncbi:cytochrome c oxidase cbb3-type subunit IV [uncultured Gammaproteobacteria bacterium]
MDIVSLGANLHSFWTVWMVAIFLGIVAYAMWPGNRAEFEKAGQIPLMDDDGREA